MSCSKRNTAVNKLKSNYSHLRGLVSHPTNQHASLHVLAEVQQPRQQLVLRDRTAAQHDARGPGDLVVQREGFNSLEALAGQTGVGVAVRLACTLCV